MSIPRPDTSRCRTPALPTRSRYRYLSRISLQAGLLLLIVACAAETEPAVDVGGIGIPLSSLEALPDFERETLLDLVAFGSAVSNAELDSLATPTVQLSLDRSALAALPSYLGAAASGLDDTALAALYLGDPEYELTVRHVIRMAEAGDPAEVHDSARITAALVLDRARKGDDFATLAARYSEEPGAAQRGGLLEPGRLGSWVAPFWDAASSLAPGETSDVVQTEYGYHVLRLEDRKQVPFEEASRRALLQRVVSPVIARGAMEAWVAKQPEVELPQTEVGALFGSVVQGEPIPSLPIPSYPDYSQSHFWGGWADLAAERRAELLADSIAIDFREWLAGEVRMASWAASARAVGVEPEDGVATSTRVERVSRMLYWASIFGFREGLPAADIVRLASDATLSGQAEVRSLRSELRGLRPYLRERYPPTFPEG